MHMNDLSYAAGFFDGEGCISAGRSTYGDKWPFIWVSVGNTDESVISWFKSKFGGNTYSAIDKRKRVDGSEKKRSYFWKLNGKYAYDFLSIIQPYLKVKSRDALLATALHLCLPSQGQENKELAEVLSEKLRKQARRKSE